MLLLSYCQYVSVRRNVIQEVRVLTLKAMPLSRKTHVYRHVLWRLSYAHHRSYEYHYYYFIETLLNVTNY